MSATGDLIEFVRKLDARQLSEDVLVQAKRCVLDLLGVAIAGSQTAMAEASARFASAQFGGGQATVIGFSRSLSPVGATWVNGNSASALDLDDGHRAAVGHPGASVTPAALATAEMLGASGLDFLVAVVAGYEVAVRASVARKSAFREGLYSTGIWGGFGAAAASAKLLKLDHTGFQRALGIAFVHGPFPGGGIKSEMVKEAIGWAGVTGCAAAFLARQGFDGPVDAFDRQSRHDVEQLVRDLGKEPAILKTYFKPHACCRWSHPAIDGVLELIHEHNVAPEEVESVLVEGFYEATTLAEPEPSTTIAGQYSIPFCIALALMYRRVGLAEVSEANLHNPQVLNLAKRVQITVDPDLNSQFPEKTAVRVTLKKRRGSATTLVEYPKGNPENPLSDVELLDKFRSLSVDLLGERRVKALKDTIDCLDQVPDIRDMTRLLSDPKG